MSFGNSKVAYQPLFTQSDQDCLSSSLYYTCSIDSVSGKEMHRCDSANAHAHLSLPGKLVAKEPVLALSSTLYKFTFKQLIRATSDDTLIFFFYYFPETLRLAISCESSA